MQNSSDIINSIINSFHENNNSHAFLLETNNINSCLSDVLSIIKKVNCNKDGNDDCNICHTIDNGTNPDVIVVKPEKREISVSQVENIISSFSTQPLINKYSMYVITEADLLSTSSANKILKFLEEPEDGIVGFFITNRISSMLPTIKSRCEHIILRYGSNNIVDLLDITDEEFEKYMGYVYKLNDILNSDRKYERLLRVGEISSCEREEILKIIKIFYKMYVMKFENVVNNEYNNLEYAQKVLEDIQEEDIIKLTNRIKLLEEFISDYKYNVNKELFINKLFILWE